MTNRRTVFAGWLVIVLLGVFTGIRINDHLTALTEVPGSPSASANAALSRTFGANSDGNFVVLYEFGQADDAEIAEFKQLMQQAASQIPTAVVQQQRAFGGVLYASIGTSLTLLQASSQTPALRAALRDVGLSKAMVTGPPALEHDVRPILAEDLQRGGLLGALLALAVLIAALGRSRRALIPVVISLSTVAGSMVVVYCMSTVIDMVLYVPSIVELVGLGLAIDYSLLLVHRHQRLGGSGDSISTTMQTAGRTVVWAGMTAAIGLAALLLVPIPLVRSLGLAGFVVPLVAVLAALTLTPPLLQSFGTRVTRGLLARESTVLWARIGQLVTTRPRAALTSSLLICMLFASPLFAVQLAPASLTALPAEAPAAQALAYLSKRLGPGAVTPHEVLISVEPGTALDARNDAARRALASELTDLPEVFGVFTDTGTNYVDSTRSAQRIFVLGRHDFADPRTTALIATLRDFEPTEFGYADDVRIEVAGAPAQGVDFLITLWRSMPWVVLLILAVAGAALSRVFGSWRIAAVSILLNLVSLAAACGVVVAVFQLGIGSVPLGTYQVPQIESWTFVFMFALLFGLTADYQVFVVRSMLEARNSSDDFDLAIRQGLARTGGIISVAALAFVFALCGLIFGRIAGLQELGVGLAAGVLIDATIVRGVMLPAAMSLIRRF